MTYKYRGYIIDTSNDDIIVRGAFGENLFPLDNFRSTREAEGAIEERDGLLARQAGAIGRGSPSEMAKKKRKAENLFNVTERPSLKDHPALHAHIDAVIDITTDEMNTLAERMKQRCQEIATAAYQDGYSAGLQERGVEKEDCRIIPIDHEVPE